MIVRVSSMHFRTLWTYTGLCHARVSRAARALTPGWALTQRRGAGVVGGHGCGGSVEEPSRCLGIMAAEGMAAERLPTCRDAGAEAGLARGFSVLIAQVWPLTPPHHRHLFLRPCE